MDRNRTEWLISHSCQVCQTLRPCTTHQRFFFLQSVDSQGGVISAAHLQLVLSQYHPNIPDKPSELKTSIVV